jgi:hypothetical protein
MILGSQNAMFPLSGVSALLIEQLLGRHLSRQLNFVL